LELNPEVEGDWYPKSNPRPAVITGSKKLCLTGISQTGVDLAAVLASPVSFTAIIYTFPIRADHLALVDSYAETHKIPVISIHSSGFYSYFQVRLPGIFPIVDTHPDENAINDLRLLNPWPELVEFCQDLTSDVDGLDDYEHGHLPFIAILFYYLKAWRDHNDSRSPSTPDEKRAFRKMVLAGMRTSNPEGGEENFEEAAAAVLKAISQPKLPASLKEVFERAQGTPVSQLPPTPPPPPPLPPPPPPLLFS